MIRHRACTLRDTAYALIKAEMDTDFEEQCQEISRTRKSRKNKVVPITGAPALLDPATSSIASGHNDGKVISWITRQLYTVLTKLIKLQGNGEATKSEIKVAKARKKGGWSQGIIKSSAKKRKAEIESESLLSNNDSIITTENKSQENGIDEDVQHASSSDGPPVLTEDPTPDDSQASDAFDSQPEIDCVPPSIISKKTVIVDVEELEALLNTIVAKTENWSLEKLLRLYSKLSKLIDRYLKRWDRQSMVEVYYISQVPHKITLYLFILFLQEMKQMLSSCRWSFNDLINRRRP